MATEVMRVAQMAGSELLVSAWGFHCNSLVVCRRYLLGKYVLSYWHRSSQAQVLREMSQHHYSWFEQDELVAEIVNVEFAIPLRAVGGWDIPVRGLQANAVTELTEVVEAVVMTTLLSDILQAGVYQGSVEDRLVLGKPLRQG